MGSLIPEAITLSIYNNTADKFGVTWQTEDRGQPVLEYTRPDDVDFSFSRRVTGEVTDSTESYKNFALIEGIAPGEECLYRVGDESGIFSEGAVFRAPDLDPERITILNMTDSQDQDHYGEWWVTAFKDAALNFPDAQFLIHTGDTVQEGGSAMMWSRMLGYSAEYIRRLPTVPTAGNHDYWYGYLHGFDSVLEKHYHIDLPPQDTRHGIYYSFDCGPVHVTVLSSGDSMETDGHGLLPEQLDWAIRDLENTDRPWKIVSVHNPLYSPGKYGSRDPLFGVALSLREQFNDVFVRCGVDLVLCGHDHVYSKTYPIGSDGLPVTDYPFEMATVNGTDVKIALCPPGPIHLESGCAGNQNRRIIEDLTDEFAVAFEEMSDMTPSAVAYSAIEIDEGLLTVTYREIDVDTGTLVKEHSFGIRK